MASKVEICNRALQKLGAKRIVSLDEDSKNARACNVAFESIKLAELADHTWNFATKRAQLAADDPGPAFGYARSFTLPADYVRLLPPDVEDNTPYLDWSIEGRKILTNDSAPLNIRYVSDVTDPNLMSPLFREALSCKIAMELAEEITQSNSKAEKAKEDYRFAIAEARRTNAIEKPAPKVADDSWVQVRR